MSKQKQNKDITALRKGYRGKKNALFPLSPSLEDGTPGHYYSSKFQQFMQTTRAKQTWIDSFINEDNLRAGVEDPPTPRQLLALRGMWYGASEHALEYTG